MVKSYIEFRVYLKDEEGRSMDALVLGTELHEELIDLLSQDQCEKLGIVTITTGETEFSIHTVVTGVAK